MTDKTLVLSNLLKLFNTDTDPFVLRVRDFSQAQAHWDFSPSPFLTVFISSWEKSRGTGIGCSRIDFAKKLITHESNSEVWETSILTKDLTNLDDENIIEEEFRDKIRGFTDEELKIKSQQYKSEISGNLTDLDPIIVCLQDKLKDLNKKEKGKILYWTSELKNLLRIADKYKNELDESALVQRSATNLMQDRGFFSGISKFIRSFSDIDISPPFLRAALLDLTLDNPYRHLLWIPYPTYQNIQQEWDESNDKDKCVSILEQQYNIFNVLEGFFEEEFVIDRKDILLESLDCAKSSKFTAASLLLYTQTEGIIFDLAKEISGGTYNGKLVEIFPDNTTSKYIDTEGNEKDFLSIMSILFESEMKNFLWPGFLEYFASDFYSQRCVYAHGQNSTILTEADYKTIALFTITVLDIFREFKDTGDAPVLSESYEKLSR